MIIEVLHQTKDPENALKQNDNCTLGTSVLTDHCEDGIGAEISLEKGNPQNLQIIGEDASDQRQSCCRVSVLKEVQTATTSKVDQSGSKDNRKRKLDLGEENANNCTEVCEDSCNIEKDDPSEDSYVCFEEAVPSQGEGGNCKRSRLTVGDSAIETQIGERVAKEEEDSLVQCDQCLERFWMKYSQKKHLRVHIIKRPYQCDVCWKRFAKEHILTSHRLLHQKEKPKHKYHPNYPCPWEPLYTFMKSHFKARHQAIGGNSADQSSIRTQEPSVIPSVSGVNNKNKAAIPVSVAQESLPLKKRRRWRWKNGISEKKKRSTENTTQDCSRNVNSQTSTASNTADVHPEMKMQLRKRRRRYNFRRGKWELIPMGHGRYLRPRKETNYRLDYTDSDCESIKSISIANQVADSSTGNSSNLTRNMRSRKSSRGRGRKVKKGPTENVETVTSSKSLARPRPLKKLTSLQRTALKFYKSNRKIKATGVARKKVNAETEESILPSDAKISTAYDCPPCTVSVERLAYIGSTNKHRNDTGDQVISEYEVSLASVDQGGSEGIDENSSIDPYSSIAVEDEDYMSSFISKEPEETFISSEDNSNVNSICNPTRASSDSDKKASMDELERTGSVVSISSHLETLHRSQTCSDAKKVSSNTAATSSRDASYSPSDSVSISSFDSDETFDGHKRMKDCIHPMKVISLKASNEGEFRFLFKKVPKEHKTKDDEKSLKKTVPGSILQPTSEKQTCRKEVQSISTHQEGEENTLQSSDGIKGTTCFVEENSSKNIIPDKRGLASPSHTKQYVSLQNKDGITVKGKSKEVAAKNMKKEHTLATNIKKSNKEMLEKRRTILIELSKDPSEPVMTSEHDVHTSTDEPDKVEKLQVFQTESLYGKDSKTSSVQKVKDRCSKAMVIGAEIQDFSSNSQETAGAVKNCCPASSEMNIGLEDLQETSFAVFKDNANTSKKMVQVSGDKSYKMDSSKKSRELLGSQSNKAASEVRNEQVSGSKSRGNSLDTVNKAVCSKVSTSQTYHKKYSGETLQGDYKASRHKSVGGIQGEKVKKNGVNKEGKKKSRRDPPSLSPAVSTNTSTKNCTKGKAVITTLNTAILKKSKHQGNHSSSLSPSRLSSHSQNYFDGKSHKECTRSRVPSLTAPETYIPRKDKSRRSVSASPSSSRSTSCFSSDSKLESVSKQSEQKNKSENSVKISSKVDDKKSTARARSYSHHSYDRKAHESSRSSALRPPNLESSKFQKRARRRSTSVIRTIKDSSAHLSRGARESERAERSAPNADSDKVTKPHKAVKKKHDSSMQTCGTGSSQLIDKGSSGDDKSIKANSSTAERSKMQTDAKRSCASVIPTKPSSSRNTTDSTRIKESCSMDPVVESQPKSQEKARKSSTSSMATIQTTFKNRSKDEINKKGTKRIHSVSKCIVLAKHAKIENCRHSSSVKSTVGDNGHRSLEKHERQTSERIPSNISAPKDRKFQKDHMKRHVSAGASNKHQIDNIPTKNEEHQSKVSNPVAGEMVRLQKRAKESNHAKVKGNNSSSHVSYDKRSKEQSGSNHTEVKEAKHHSKSNKVDAPTAAKKCSPPSLVSDDKRSKKDPESNSLNSSEKKTSKTLKNKEENDSLGIETGSSKFVGPAEGKVSIEKLKKRDTTQTVEAISQNRVGLKSSSSTSLRSTSSHKSHSINGVHRKGSKSSKSSTSIKETSVPRKDVTETCDKIAPTTPEVSTCSVSNDLKSISNVSRLNFTPPSTEVNTEPLASLDVSKRSNNTIPLLSIVTVEQTTAIESRHKSYAEISKGDSQKSDLNPTALKAQILWKEPTGNNVDSSGNASKHFHGKSSSLDSKISDTATKPSVSVIPDVDIHEEVSLKNDLNSATAKSIIEQKDVCEGNLNPSGSPDSCDTSSPPSKQKKKDAVQVEDKPPLDAFTTLLLIVTTPDLIPMVAPSTSESVMESSSAIKSGLNSKYVNGKEDAGERGSNLAQVEASRSEESIHVAAEQIMTSSINNMEVKSSEHCSKNDVLDRKALEGSILEEIGQTNQPSSSSTFSHNSNHTANYEESDRCYLNSAAEKAVNSSEGTLTNPFVSSAFLLAKSNDSDPKAINPSASHKNPGISCTVESVSRLNQNSDLMNDLGDKTDLSVVDAFESQDSYDNCPDRSTGTAKKFYCSFSSDNRISNPGHSEGSQSSESIKSLIISQPPCITSADHSERTGSLVLHNTHAISDPPSVKYLCTKCHSLTSSSTRASNSTTGEVSIPQTDSGSSGGIASGNSFYNSASHPKSSSIIACTVSSKSNEGKIQEIPGQNPSKPNTSDNFGSSDPKGNLRAHPLPRKPRLKYISTNRDSLSRYSNVGSSASNPIHQGTSNSTVNAVASADVIPISASLQFVNKISNCTSQRNDITAERPELKNSSSQNTSSNNVESPGSTSIMSNSENLEWKLIPITINPPNHNLSKTTAAETNSKTSSICLASNSTSISSNSGDKVCNEDSENRSKNTSSLMTEMQRSLPQTNWSPLQCRPRRPKLSLSSAPSCFPTESQRIHNMLEQLEIIKASYLEVLHGSGSKSWDQGGEETATNGRDTSQTNLKTLQVLSTSSGSISTSDGLESSLKQTEQTHAVHSEELVLQTPSIIITQMPPSHINAAAERSSLPVTVSSEISVNNQPSRATNCRDILSITRSDDRTGNSSAIRTSQPQTVTSGVLVNNQPSTITNHSGTLSITISDHSSRNSSAKRASVPETVSSEMFLHNQPSTSSFCWDILNITRCDPSAGNPAAKKYSIPEANEQPITSSFLNNNFSLNPVPKKSMQCQDPSKEKSVQHSSILNPSGAHPEICTSQGDSSSSVLLPTTSKNLSNHSDYFTNNGPAQCPILKTADSLDSEEADESESAKKFEKLDSKGSRLKIITRNLGKNQPPLGTVSTSQSTSMQSDSSSSKSVSSTSRHDSGNGCDSYKSDKSLFQPGTSPMAGNSTKLKSDQCRNNMKPPSSSLNQQDSNMSISDDSGGNLDTSSSCRISMQNNSKRSYGNSVPPVSNCLPSHPIRPIIPLGAYMSRNPVHYSGCSASRPMLNNRCWNSSLPTLRFYPPYPYRPYMHPYGFKHSFGNYHSSSTFPPFIGGNSSGGPGLINPSYHNQLGSNNARVASRVRSSVSHRRESYGPPAVGNASSRSSYFASDYSGGSTMYSAGDTEYLEESFTVNTNNLGWDDWYPNRGSMR